MKAIIVDDDPAAIKILEVMMSEAVPQIEILARCTDPLEAVGKIKTLNPEIVFLDVHMPGLTGFQLLQRTGIAGFDVIVTTSSENHALEAIRSGATDYLIKPVQSEELKRAVTKITNRKNEHAAQQLEMIMTYFRPQKPRPRRIALTASDHLVFVDANDVIYCESDSNYTTFFLTSGDKVVISKTLKDVEEMLDQQDFFRIHASYLVNMKHVAKYTRGDGGNVVMSNNKQIAVSRKKKDEFFEKFSKL
jgi:two-component system, LytTR family, response regulator